MSTTVAKRNLTAEVVEVIKRSIGADREFALNRFSELQFPGSKSEEYKFAPITRMLEKHFTNWPILRPNSIELQDEWLTAPGQADVHRLVFVNGQLMSEHSNWNADEITVESLSNNGTWQGNDPFGWLSAAAAPTTTHVSIGPGRQISKPIYLLHITGGVSTTTASSSRLNVVLGNNSRATLMQRTLVIGTQAAFLNNVEEISIGEESHLDYYKVQDAASLIHVGNTIIHQATRSQVDTFTLTLDGIAIRNNLTIRIDGENCESHFHGLYLLKGETLADNHTVVDHLKPNSFSNEMYKGVMDDRSKGVFNGKIFVRPHAQKTNAFQSNRNILLSETATVNTKPQLEIWADDVKCSHGCTTGQLDEEALFYLRARGIPKDSARALLLYAFASEVLQIVPETPVKSYLDGLVSERLHKDF